MVEVVSVPEKGPLRIGLDYDGTVTAAPDLFYNFIIFATHLGYEVHIITMRPPKHAVNFQFSEAVKGRVHYTNYQAKRTYMEEHGIHINIWVDDHPDMILHSLSPELIRDGWVEEPMKDVSNG